MTSADRAQHAPLAGQVALVTGAGRGIGRHLALELARAGARVGLLARSAPAIEQTRADIQALGGAAEAVAVDVARPGPLRDAVARLQERLGPVDLLVNNAGITTPLGPLAETDLDAWWYGLEVNLRGPLVLAHAVLGGMQRRRRGRIVNVVSRAGLEAVANHSAYTVSKCALIRLTEQIALEAAPHGVSAFALNPGPVRSEMSGYLLDSDEGRRWLPAFGQRFQEAEVPLEHVGRVFMRLAGGHADGLSGQVVSAAGFPLT